MKLEMAEGGYEKIDACIQEIENLATEGVFTGTLKRFHDIRQMAKKLRQILRDVLLINPEKNTAAKEPTEAA